MINKALAAAGTFGNCEHNFKIEWQFAVHNAHVLIDKAPPRV